MPNDSNQAIPVQFFKAMMAEGDERKRKLAEVAEGLRIEMEALAIRMKELVLSQLARRPS